MYKIVIGSLQVFLLYGIYLVGVWIQESFHLTMPGSMIGMLLLFILLLTKMMPLAWVQEGCHFLLSHLPLFFIPVTVGVMEFGFVFKGKGLLLIPVVLASTILVMVISAKILEWLMSKELKKGSHE
ncbi:CidA/LrgA family protein [Pseudalkalibacillus berkeleyi]|uniref:CidA/LrgA family protein n=1 Tax=Pseudalkalibacillus berkeleyi TaxID=1069813 RepID=A0ABS9H395_9BACL|nr:CidA/LrgA family protein [Pseudalkalibacillus berkeleyi]MCF6138333.1 CidA/LrgA family protein [Pseudalkalibacillus berkeleyi]